MTGPPSTLSHLDFSGEDRYGDIFSNKRGEVDPLVQQVTKPYHGTDRFEALLPTEITCGDKDLISEEEDAETEFRRAYNLSAGYNSDQSDHFVGDSDRELSADELLAQLRSKIDDRVQAVLCMTSDSNGYTLCFNVIGVWMLLQFCTYKVSRTGTARRYCS